MQGLGGGCGGAAHACVEASRLAPLALRCSTQSCLPLRAAIMTAVWPSYGGAAAASHAVSGGGEGGAAEAAGGEGRGRGREEG